MHRSLTRRFRRLPRRFALVLSLLALIGQVMPGAIGPARSATISMLVQLAAASTDCAGTTRSVPHAPKPTIPRGVAVCPLAAALAAPGALPAAGAPALPAPVPAMRLARLVIAAPRAPPRIGSRPAAARAPPAFV